MVLADHTRIRQVLINLLTNAVKYNREAGKIIVSSGETDGDSLRVTVTDTGEGIPEDRQTNYSNPPAVSALRIAITRALASASSSART